MKTRLTTLITLVAICALALTLRARPLPVLGEGAEPLPERSYSNAAAILEHLLQSMQGENGCRESGTLSDALGILYDLADEPVTDPASRARCAALLVPLLTNQQTGYDVAVLLQELPPDFLDAHHSELYQFLVKTPRDFEDVIGIYAMLPSCDVTFATNKAQQMQSWLLMRDAILARHGDQAALEQIQRVATTYNREMDFSANYLSRVLALVRTRPMLEFLVRGLRSDDIIDMPGGIRLLRRAIHLWALRTMLRYEVGFNCDADYQMCEQWCIERYGIILPKDTPPMKHISDVSASDIPASPADMPCAATQTERVE